MTARLGCPARGGLDHARAPGAGCSATVQSTQGSVDDDGGGGVVCWLVGRFGRSAFTPRFVGCHDD